MKNISGSLQKQFLGEARFLRAFNYFMLVRAFGSVPMHDKVVEGVDQGQAPYASIEELYAFIISDLEEAITMMEVQKQQGRADKLAAQLLLAKVYLTMAISRMTGSPGYVWEQAIGRANVCLQVTNTHL